MWNRSNWCERTILISLGTILFLLLFNIFIQNAVLSGWLFLYTVLVIILSIWITCRDIQYLLEQNTPLKADSNDVLSKHSTVNFIGVLVPIFKKILPPKNTTDKRAVELTKKRAINVSSCSDISTIASVIERKCVWSWYSQYVSKEIAFPFACKELLDQMVTKVFQVSNNIDTVSLCSDSLAVILRHCKEYKRAAKRFEKNGNGRIEEYYRNSHPTSAQRNSHTISTRGKSTQSHCLLLTRAFLKELLPWELWGTPHAGLLASILAKRLDMFVSNDLSNPVWLKNKLAKILETKQKVLEVDKPIEVATPVKIVVNTDVPVNTDYVSTTKHSYTPIDVKKEVTDNYDFTKEKCNEPAVVMKTSIESALSNMISNTTAPILQRAELEKSSAKSILHGAAINQEVLKPGAVSILKKPTQPIDIKSSPSHSLNGQDVSNSGGKKSSNEVKIYDKVVDGSVKTWNSDVDLECVSLGQDLLASLDGELGFESRLGRLWEADGADSSEAWSPNPPSTGSSTKTPYGLWFGEEDTLDMDLTEESPPKNMVQTNTSHSITNFNITKPLSIHNMKELQNISKNTVNQAKHKIGDLQVCPISPQEANVECAKLRK